MPRLLRLGAAVAALTAPLAAQTVDDGYEIGTWQGFRDGAVTISFDDNTANQLPVALPILDAVGLKATFFVTTNWVGGQWPGFAAAAANGHEVAVHTRSHPDLSTLTVEQQRAQLEGARDAILANVPEAEALTLAYPFCVPGDRALVEELFIAARVCSGQIDRATPADLYATSSYVIGAEVNRTTAASLNALADAAAAQRGWATYLLHGIDGDGGYSPFPSDELETHVAYLAANPDKFWVATYVDVVRYLRERDAASVTELSATDDAITVEITDDLDDAIYTTPITVRRVLPDDWEAATVAQDGAPVPAAIIQAGAETFVEFDVVPDRGTVTLTKSDATSPAGAPEAGPSYVVGSRPNPFRGRTTFVYEVGEAGPVTVEVYDRLGRRLETLVDAVLPAGRHVVTWDASRYGAGAYTYRLHAGGRADAGQTTLAR
ncbi:polysaccharide deacetylase family protein [Rubrivirga marina]|uniref:NodB homology domain-containing protein n=1 Tax=Rubrivirga marina TaxID=1196024 RepID=A0A271IV78_9BACT|nr:polysaccharide deacetylase family protein [Rubrivirga marina]PAP75027.1 hypothetical protein BSZ37_00445 [Rubrivirga marina]